MEELPFHLRAGEALAQVWEQNRDKSLTKAIRNSLTPGVVDGARLRPFASSREGDTEYANGYSVGEGMVKILKDPRLKVSPQLIVELAGWHYRQHHK